MTNRYAHPISKLLLKNDIKITFYFNLHAVFFQTAIKVLGHNYFVNGLDLIT